MQSSSKMFWERDYYRRINTVCDGISDKVSKMNISNLKKIVV